MVRRLEAFCALTVIVAIASCGPAASEPDPLPEIFPLTIGNEWTYSRVDSFKSVIPPIVSSRVFTTRVLDTARLNQLNWTLVHDPGFHFACCDSASYIRYWVGGLMQLAPQPLLNGVLLFPWPVQVGSRTFSLKVESLDTTITVPAGTFHTVYYAPADSTSLWAFFIAPNIGIVKRVQTLKSRNPNGQLVPFAVEVDQLSSYVVNP